MTISYDMVMLQKQNKELQEENEELKAALSEKRQNGYYIKGYISGYTACKKDVMKLIKRKDRR